MAGIGVHGVGSSREVWADRPVWSIHVYGYRAKLRIDREWYEVIPGAVSIIATGSTAEYLYTGRSEHAYMHFEPGLTTHSPWEVPAFSDLGTAQDRLRRALEEGVSWLAAQPARAAARLWDVLWELARPARGDAAAPHPGVLRAMELIEIQLARHIVLPDLARQCGLSHNHLIRLFHRHAGRSIQAYVRHRRCERARHLIVATDQPIKSIAAQVGLSDLQQFNKTIRKELGIAPTALRQRARLAPRDAEGHG